MAKKPPLDLAAKFRAVSRELRARYEGALVAGKHTIEKGLRTEAALRDFLRRHLPPRFGLSRGEIVSARGEVSHQVDIVIYDAHHAPLLEESEASMVFAAESVYAAIEVKPTLQQSTIDEVAQNIASVKALDRSATVEQHGGHRVYGGPRQNPAIFGAVFAFDGGRVAQTLVPRLHHNHTHVPREQWVDCICILDKAVIYHFGPGPREGEFRPAFIGPDTVLGYWDAGKDALLLFYLMLMHQLNARDLFPPDLHRYATALDVPGMKLYVPSSYH